MSESLAAKNDLASSDTVLLWTILPDHKVPPLVPGDEIRWVWCLLVGRIGERAASIIRMTTALQAQADTGNIEELLGVLRTVYRFVLNGAVESVIDGGEPDSDAEFTGGSNERESPTDDTVSSESIFEELRIRSIDEDLVVTGAKVLIKVGHDDGSQGWSIRDYGALDDDLFLGIMAINLEVMERDLLDFWE